MSSLELKVPPVFVPVICVVLMYLTRAVVPSFNFSQTTATLISGLIASCAVIFAALGILEFRKSQTTVNPMEPSKATALVKTGVFAVSRNPMYVSFVMLTAAGGVAVQNSFALFFCVFAIWYLQRFQIIPEERILNDIFGDEYKIYCRKVSRWI